MVKKLLLTTLPLLISCHYIKDNSLLQQGMLSQLDSPESLEIFTNIIKGHVGRMEGEKSLDNTNINQMTGTI